MHDCIVKHPTFQQTATNIPVRGKSGDGAVNIDRQNHSMTISFDFCKRVP